MKKRALLVISVVLAVFMSFSSIGYCFQTSVKSITLEKSVTLTEGQVYQLEATVSPANAGSSDLKWLSGNSKIATVTSKGSVKAVKTGTATITVKTSNGKITAKCTVTVLKSIPLTIFGPTFAKYESKKDSIIKQIEKKTGTTLKFVGCSVDAWPTKMNLLMSSGDVPDLFQYMNSLELTTWVDQGLATTFDQYLGNAPYVKALLSLPNFKNLKHNGKYMMVPLVTEIGVFAIYARQDWMDKLGIKQPKTLAEFTAMVKAFTEKDPDGNGKNDTIGITGDNNFMYLSPFYHAFGCNEGFVKQSNGLYSDDMWTEKFKKGIMYVRDLYQKGYMEQEFFLKDSNASIQSFESGKAGVLCSNGTWLPEQLMQKTLEVNPNAKITCLEPPAGPDGTRGFMGSGGYWGFLGLSKKGKYQDRAVSVINYLLSPEGEKLKQYGIEGQHYTVKNGKIVPNIAGRKADVGDMETFGKDFTSDYILTGTLGEYTVSNGMAILKKDFTTAKYPEFQKKVYDMAFKFAVNPDSVNTNFPNEVQTFYGRVWGDMASYPYKMIAAKTDKEAEDAWTEYMGKLNDRGLDAVCKIETDYLKNLGLAK